MMKKRTKITNDDSLKNKEFNNKNTSSLEKFSYLKIEPSNNFKKITPEEIQSINEKIEKNIKDKFASKKDFINEIIKKFLERNYPKYEINTSKIIQIISNQIKTKKKLNGERMEVYINFFYNSKDNFKSSTTLVLNKRIFRNIGIMLCYIYFKLKDYPIDSNGIKEYINTIVTKKINVISDYFLYCNNVGCDPMLTKKAYEWRKLVKIYNYQVPPELIFLINTFQNCLKLEINMEFDQDILTQEDLQLYTMTLLNIEYVFPNLENISINLIHKKLQEFLNKKTINNLSSLILKNEETFKKNVSKDNNSLYSIKWDFDKEFNLAYFNNIKANSKKNKKNISNDEYNIINLDEKEIDLLSVKNNISSEKNKLSLSQINIPEKKSNKLNDIGFVDLELDEMDNDTSSSTTNSSSEIFRVKTKQNMINETFEEKQKKYFQKIDNFKMIIDFIIMTFCTMSWNQSVRKLNLLSNNFYSKGLITYMKHFFDFESKKTFHFLDILYNKPNGYDSINIEFNSLDIFIFNKLLDIFYMNMSLTSINISFFSADISYLLSNLFQIYSEQLKTYSEIKNYISIKGSNFNTDEFEKKILDDISSRFCENLEILFELIKKKKDLKELGLNFDMPIILSNNNNYKISIFKFILNILMLVDNNESKHKSSIKKLTILAPKIIFDSKKEKNIDNFFKNISIYYKTKTLINLNLQFQFYKISYIQNLISTNLFTLNIGDLDIYTFDKLIQYLTCYDFSINSNLSHLSIKLLGMFTNFNIQMKLLLQRLFNISLRNLLELKLFTNLIIDKKANYLFFLKLLQNNSIPSYLITLNKKSKKTIAYFNLFKVNKIYFLVSETIQNLVFKDAFNLMRQHNFFLNEIYWVIKIYLLRMQKRNDIFVGKFGMQGIIFTILKYLFFTSNVKLEHQYIGD